MLKCLIRRQWKKAAWLILAFCAVFLLRGQMEDMLAASLLPFQKAYMKQQDLTQKDAFFQQLDKDAELADQVIDTIDRYETYEGEIPAGQVDIMDQLTGSAVYADYSMLLWRDQMYQMPGRLTDTVRNDYYLTRQLANRLINQRDFSEILENHTETMRRGLRRGGSASAKYGYALEQLNAIDRDFSVTDPYYAQQILSHLSADWYILVILALSVFGVFATCNQQKVSNAVLISPLGIRRFAWRQILASVMISTLCLVLYYPLVIFICCAGDLGAVPWDHPVQILSGCENILLDMTVGQYIFVCIGIKALFCLLLVSVVLYASAMSPNNAVSLLLTAAICGVLLLLFTSGSKLSGLWIGHAGALFYDLSYFAVNDTVISYSLVYGLSLLVSALAVQGLTVAQCGFAARRWVK